MHHEYEVELLRETLAERRLQVAADAEASRMQATAEHASSLIGRLYSLFRVDPTDVPVSHQAARRMQGHYSR